MTTITDDSGPLGILGFASACGMAREKLERYADEILANGPMYVICWTDRTGSLRGEDAPTKEAAEARVEQLRMEGIKDAEVEARID